MGENRSHRTKLRHRKDKIKKNIDNTVGLKGIDYALMDPTQTGRAKLRMNNGERQQAILQQQRAQIHT